MGFRLVSSDVQLVLENNMMLYLKEGDIILLNIFFQKKIFEKYKCNMQFHFTKVVHLKNDLV